MSDDKSIFIGGDNRDAATIESNGVGKSLLYDAIVWGLYDVTVRGFSKDAVIGPFDVYTCITQEWKDDEGRIISIERYRKHPKYHNEARVFVDGVEASKVTTIKKFGTNAQIIRLIGIDSISFLHSIVFSKGRGSVCDEREAGRRKLLSHILNLERFDEAQKAARYDKKQHEKIINAIEIKYASKKTEYFETKARINDAKDNLKDEEKRIDHQKKIVEEKREEIKLRKKECIKDLENTQNFLKTLYSEQNRQRKMVSRIDELDSMILLKKRTLGEIESKLAHAQQDYETARAAVTACKHQKGTLCPTCRRVISAAHVRKNVFDLRHIMHEKKAEKVHQVNRKKKRLSKISGLVLERNKVESFLDKSLDGKIRNNEYKIKDLEREIASLKPFEISFENHIEKYKEQIESLSYRLKNISREMTVTVQKREREKIALGVSEFWIDGFGSKGLKKYIINGILDYLESKTNEYLFELTEGYMKINWVSETELKTSGKKIDKLLLHVTTGSRGGKEYHHCSKGEQARVWLAMELALNSLIRSTIDLALVDEAFDGLDSAGMTRAIKLLSDEGSRRKLLCISHAKGIDRYFEKKKLVIMEKDQSRLEDR